MDNIYRGEMVSKGDFIDKLPELRSSVEKDLLLPRLMPEIVIDALHILSDKINQMEVAAHLVGLGIQKWSAEQYVSDAVKSIQKEELQKKLHNELGDDPFKWKDMGNGIEECNYPLGVIIHIGAGNTLGLSAFSVIEGLLTGNINILKLPENEGGISSRILSGLVEIEPRLKPYIYVLDISSKDQEALSNLIQVTDAVAIWGSDEAIAGIRKLAPPYLPIIEWGHKLSFAYFTKNEHEDMDLERLAAEICITDQLYCSSPQCVFYEADNMEEVNGFADRLAINLERISGVYPSAIRPIDVQARITWIHEFIRTEEIFESRRLITDDKREYGVMIDYEPELKTSPLFRNIWVMPIDRTKVMEILRPHKGHLQTVGLSCNKDELNQLTQIFYAAGVTRITRCGSMSANYSGEPHDGVPALHRYVKRINRMKV